MNEREEFMDAVRDMEPKVRGGALCDIAEIIIDSLDAPDLAKVVNPVTGMTVVAARGDRGVVLDKVFDDLARKFGADAPRNSRPSTTDMEFKQYADLMDIVSKMRIEDVQRVLCGVALMFMQKAPEAAKALDGTVAMLRGGETPIAVMVGLEAGSLFVRGAMQTLKAKRP